MFSLSIFSSLSFHSLICLEYLSRTSNGCWLFCSWGCWKLCGWGCGCGYGWGWGAEGFGVHPWLILLIIPVLFSMLFFIFANGAIGPHEHFSVTCLGITMTLRIASILGCSSVLMVGAGVGTGVGGIGHSFLVLNRFSDADPALHQGVPCLIGTLGMSSSSRGLTLSFRDQVVGHGTSANCPVASLHIVTSIDSAVDLTISVCVLTVATMGVAAVDVGVEGVGWVSPLTLYLLLTIIVFLLLSVTFVFGSGDFLTLDLVLGWASLSWFGCISVCCGWVWGWGLDLGPCLPSSFKYVLIFQMREE